MSAVLDQGLFAASNFAVSILLARWLSLENYGAFALVYSVYALMANVHGGFIPEPLLVFGSGRHAAIQHKYLGIVLRGHWVLALALSAILVVAALVAMFLDSPPIAAAFWGLALAAPFLWYRYVARTAAYMILKPRLAALAAGIYAVIMFSGIFVLYRTALLSSTTAFLLMGLASLGSGLWLFTRVKPTESPVEGALSGREVIREHATYGRWAAGTGILWWLPTQVYFLVLPIWASLETTAHLKAILNLITPIAQGFGAVGVLLVAALVRYRGQPQFRRVVLSGMVFFTGLASLYWLLLVLFHEPIIRWLYAGQYLAYHRLPWILGLVPVASGSVTMLHAALNALERPDRVFWAYVASSLVTVTLGFGLTVGYGVEGAAWGMVAASATTTIAMSWFFFAKSSSLTTVGPSSSKT